MTKLFKRICQWWDDTFFQRLWLELRWEWVYSVFGEFSNLEGEEYYIRRQQELAQQAQEAFWREEAEAWIAEHRGRWTQYGIYEFDEPFEPEDYYNITGSDCTGAYNAALADGPVDWDTDDPLPW